MEHTYNPWHAFQGAFIPNWLLIRTEVSQGAKLCFARLMQFAGKRGVAYPTEEALAAELGVRPRQVRNYVAELRRHQLVATTRGGPGDPLKYFFLLHPWMDMQPPTEALEPAPEAVSKPPPRARNGIAGLGGTIVPVSVSERQDSAGKSGSIVPLRPAVSCHSYKEEENHGRESVVAVVRETPRRQAVEAAAPAAATPYQQGLRAFLALEQEFALFYRTPPVGALKAELQQAIEFHQALGREVTPADVAAARAAAAAALRERNWTAAPRYASQLVPFLAEVLDARCSPAPAPPPPPPPPIDDEAQELARRHRTELALLAEAEAALASAPQERVAYIRDVVYPQGFNSPAWQELDRGGKKIFAELMTVEQRLRTMAIFGWTR